MFSIGKRKVRSKMTGFVEVSQNEMMEVDGGIAPAVIVIAVILLLACAAPAY